MNSVWISLLSLVKPLTFQVSLLRFAMNYTKVFLLVAVFILVSPPNLSSTVVIQRQGMMIKSRSSQTGDGEDNGKNTGKAEAATSDQKEIGIKI